jgi:hypothetical protein
VHGRRQNPVDLGSFAPGVSMLLSVYSRFFFYIVLNVTVFVVPTSAQGCATITSIIRSPSEYRFPRYLSNNPTIIFYVL